MEGRDRPCRTSGVAYSPKTGKLFAVDFAWMDEKKAACSASTLRKKGEEVSVERDRRFAQ